MTVRARGARRVLILAAALAAAVPPALTPNPPPAAAAPGESTESAPNPDLIASCGIDIHVVLDKSGSIANAGATDEVQGAFRTFTSALRNTGSRMSVSEFASRAALPIPEYTTVTDATIASTFEPYISSFAPNGGTNWEDGFRVPRYFAPRPDPNRAHLTLFITDGNPNVVVDNRQTTFSPGSANPAENEYELKLPLSSGEVTEFGNNEQSYAQAAPPAVSNANGVKAQGSHILALAVGDGLDGTSTLDRLISVSGPDVFTGSGSFDIETTDVYRVSDFSDLEASLRDAAFQLCAPSVTIQKLVDQNPDPGVDDLQPGQGWEMEAQVAPTPSSWTLPPDATGSTATATTDAPGFAAFQWENPTPTTSSFTVSETPQAGFVNDPDATECTYITPDITTPTAMPGFSASDGGFTGSTPSNAIVTCQMVNRVVPAPEVTLVKSTNGADANEPSGPSVPVGDPVEWSYLVTNSGNVTLTDVAVVDDQLGAIACPDATLAAGASTTCVATGTAEPGQHANTGTVTADAASGGTVTDDDPSHYFGAVPGIDVEKATNGDDADDAPGVFVLAGSTVTWTYVVTNTGETPLTAVTVTDDQIGPITCPETELAVGGSMTCTATGEAAAGPYQNVATAEGLAGAAQVADSDASHHFGETLGIAIEKTTNGEDADTPTGPEVLVGDAVVWRYDVTNTSNVPLEFDLTDSEGVPARCPRIGTIEPGGSVSCDAIGAAEAGQYENVGTVVGTAPSGDTVTASDPSHYVGVVPAIDIVKSTNGDAANEAPGPLVEPGDPVTWTYDVTNTGDTDLSDIEVTDDRIGTITCPTTSLAAGASMTCTATGTAEADQYTNHARVTGVPTTGGLVDDTDVSHYLGEAPGILVEKLTEGVDADDEPGPFVPAGDAVVWTYDVTNGGNVPLEDVAVVDDQGVTVNCPQATLAVGETMRCTATGTAERGQEENLATATGHDDDGDEVSSADPGHYFGYVTAIDVEKATDGEDADAAPGPSVPVGDPVEWTYVVTNPGDIPLLDVTVTDDQGVEVVFDGGDADDDGALDPGETWRYTASGRATAGQYANVATATGKPDFEDTEPISDRDPSHYVGVEEPGTPGEPGPGGPGTPGRPGGPGGQGPSGGRGPTGLLPSTGASLLGLIVAGLVALVSGAVAMRARRAARRRAARRRAARRRAAAPTP
jgi:hypothetical protein